MDCSNAHIYNQEQLREIKESFPAEAFEQLQAHLVPITSEQHKELEPLGELKRKGYMRNQPCVCGSGEKFKKCCWNQYK